ncbi:zinc-ribbon domain-containing protein [Alkaliphilus peptidifermentans]
MNCSNCHKEISSDSKFCAGCGYAFPAPALHPDKCPKCDTTVLDFK